MASVGDSGDDKNPNTELNLVPFIDLMSVLITFLLITAVWSQVSMIQIGTSIYGKKTKDEIAPPPPDADIPFRLDVKEFGYRVVIGRQTLRIPKMAETYDDSGLAVELKKVKEMYPAKVDAVITVDDEIKYEYLIKGMDALLQAGFPAISVATGGTE